jgi:protein gp37
MGTLISWTDETWNPVTGCTKVSAGCDHCYAEALAERFRGQKAFPNGFDLTLHPERLNKPLTWKQPRRVFVNSMSDLFHARVPTSFVEQIWRVMLLCPQHTFQILTKRPERMARFAATHPAPRHVWLGTSVEDQRVARRVDALRECDAQVRFLSCEPLIGPLDLRGKLDGIHW